MGEVSSLAVEAGALRRHGNTIGQRHRIGFFTGLHRLCDSLQATLHLKDSPRKSGRVSTIKDDGVKAIKLKMLNKPASSSLFLLRDSRSLVDTPSIFYHDRCYQPGIFGPPPSRHPVTTALFLKSAVTEEYDQSLAR